MRGIHMMALGLALTPLAAAAETDAVCVGNASNARLFFVAEARDGARKTSWLESGATLCVASESAASGVVSAFPSPDVLEGCSRLSPPGRLHWLEDYTGVDVCRWRLE